MKWWYVSMIIIKIRHLKEAFATLVAEVGSLVVVLFPNFDKHEVFFLYFFVLFRFLLRSPVKDRGISVCEFSSAIFTLVDLSHPMAERLLFEKMFFFFLALNEPRQVLLQVARGGKALFAELTLPGLVFVVHSIDVHSHVVASHEHLVTLETFYISLSSSSTASLPVGRVCLVCQDSFSLANRFLPLKLLELLEELRTCGSSPVLAQRSSSPPPASAPQVGDSRRHCLPPRSVRSPRLLGTQRWG